MNHPLVELHVIPARRVSRDAQVVINGQPVPQAVVAEISPGDRDGLHHTLTVLTLKFFLDDGDLVMVQNEQRISGPDAVAALTRTIVL